MNIYKYSQHANKLPSEGQALHPVKGFLQAVQPHRTRNAEMSGAGAAKKKFVNKVEQITFSGDYANKVHQPVLYITERAVFELRPEGVTLIEIAPGIDLQTQVLDQMEFMPKIADDLKLMDERIFHEGLMGLAND